MSSRKSQSLRSYRDLAGALGIPFVIVDFAASEAALRERVARRAAGNADASDADLPMLEQQLRKQEPLGVAEMSDVVRYDADAPLERVWEASAWDGVRSRLGAS